MPLPDKTTTARMVDALVDRGANLHCEDSVMTCLIEAGFQPDEADPWTVDTATTLAVMRRAEADEPAIYA